MVFVFMLLQHTSSVPCISSSGCNTFKKLYPTFSNINDDCTFHKDQILHCIVFCEEDCVSLPQFASTLTKYFHYKIIDDESETQEPVQPIKTDCNEFALQLRSLF